MRFGLSDHLKALLDFVFGSRPRVKKVRIFRAWFSHEGQNVYGPSLATVEDVVIEPCQSGGTSTKHVTSLGMSKATHEFLTLHYFALDSAEWWERILGELLPNAHFPDAAVRRTFAYKMFIAAHIAPSHRRLPHPVWEDSLCLIADLLFGNGMVRYYSLPSATVLPAVQDHLSGF